MYFWDVINSGRRRATAKYAAELLLPAADVCKVWAREAGKDTYQAVKILAGIFAVPEDRARARVAELGLITKG